MTFDPPLREGGPMSSSHDASGATRPGRASPLSTDPQLQN
jgi:hypothetical protein